MFHGKQFTLYTHNRGPNGWYVFPSSRPHRILTPDLLTRKVAIILEELELTYESVYLDFNKGEQKAPEFLKINSNGRIPALAILECLVDKCDKDHKLSSTGLDKYIELQWLAFQVKGVYLLRGHPSHVAETAIQSILWSIGVVPAFPP